MLLKLLRAFALSGIVLYSRGKDNRMWLQWTKAMLLTKLKLTSRSLLLKECQLELHLKILNSGFSSIQIDFENLNYVKWGGIMRIVVAILVDEPLK
ncbi:hypothetical protein PVK06_033781 [Gossypium arboreum]|uniref:Uncharacterized protein n=1 Tax=Gossypium arboreum TaxID=29729 RepID=A0ABR0NDC2_GOSAR|nr:hypothetical protein PVK06_033781 [Gossypium arboreum]